MDASVWLALLTMLISGTLINTEKFDVTTDSSGLAKLKKTLAQSERNSDRNVQTWNQKNRTLDETRRQVLSGSSSGLASLKSKMAATSSIEQRISAKQLATSSNNLSDVFCDFESPCPWTGEMDGFKLTSGIELSVLMNKSASTDRVSGPSEDADGNQKGHFLYLRGRSEDREKHRQVYSEWYNSSMADCRLTFTAHVHDVLDSKLQILVETERTSWIIADITLATLDKWTEINKAVGGIKQRFRLIIEVWIGSAFPSHAAFDNIRLLSCLPGVLDHRSCSGLNQFECQPGVCIDNDRVCDFKTDCPNNEDEDERCDQLAQRWNTYCDFESGGMCGWDNSIDDDMEWVRYNGSVNVTGYDPQGDHTYQNTTGHYMYLKTTVKGTMGHKAILKSPIFLPPPRDTRDYRTTTSTNKCSVRFFYRMYGTHKPVGSLALILTIFNQTNLGRNNVTLWEKDRSEDDRKWHRISVPLIDIHARYRLEFVGFRGLRHTGHISIDDVSLSPTCLPNNGSIETYEFGTCGAKGPRGPTQKECNVAYIKRRTNVTVSKKGTLDGIQQWTVPTTGLYSISARGAGGGRLDRNKRISRGSSAGSVFNFNEGETIFLLVGQQGSGPCRKSQCLGGHSARSTRSVSKLMKILKESKEPEGNSGSGGGGATYVFKMASNGRPVPLLVAAGGGGLAHIMNVTGISPDGYGENRTLPPTNGLGSEEGAGGGGGWKGSMQFNSSGMSLSDGAIGGSPCAAVFQLEAYGGFGGGGGACMSGGGGGGYTGGDATAVDIPAENGQGGYSYAGGTFPHARRGFSSNDIGGGGDGSIQITPAFVGCGCSFMCVVLTDENNPYACLCNDDANLDEDEHTCLAISQLPHEKLSPFIVEHLWILLPLIILFIGCVASIMFFMYHRYRRQLLQTTRQEYFSNPEMQLNRLRQNGGVEGVGQGMITEYNPNYEFGGSTCTLQDLREVPRENLSLVKALGQGAFGEVYQGCLANVPIPVAIKTLPELSSSQAEMDFLTEALIMSKFNHPNIVKFIGVCFDKMPKFIILELLPGGDLKTFLRESRPKPDNPSPLNMIDLLLLAIDVAKGCKYLEENHFIHRDIAARNCLLTSRDTKRVVKIADFGMARDIYRADYYRKGGKAMLPVKWMPPEAFLDGIFTSKTDIWSFGVLLWEVMSMGYMPYPGRGNQDVMQLVTSGGRLEPPSNCPQPMYHIMSHCWHPAPEERPTFTTILERLGYCLQDPDVLNSQLPVFHRPPSTERDTTVMRPSDSDNVCLQVQRMDNEPQSPASTDYLIPIPSSSYSLCTEKTELQSASSVESVDHLLELDGEGQAAAAAPVTPMTSLPVNSQPPSSWETSFMQKQSGTIQSQTTPRGYQSVPTQEDTHLHPVTSTFKGPSIPFSTIAPPESSPARKSPPSDIARQRPSVKKPLTPLDPSTLSKQHPSQVLPYANVLVAASAIPTTTMTTKTDVAKIPTPYTITSAASKAPSTESEAKC